MLHRTYLSKEERESRSQLQKLIRSNYLLRASIVKMARTCGKENCKCLQGEKHVSLYLSALVGKKRKMIYIPPPWEERVQRWVENYREADAFIDQISNECLKRFLDHKSTNKNLKKKRKKQ